MSVKVFPKRIAIGAKLQMVLCGSPMRLGLRFAELANITARVLRNMSSAPVVLGRVSHDRLHPIYSELFAT